MMVMFMLLICSICAASVSPSKMKIGDVEGQWTYIGRYGVPSRVTIKEFVLYAQPHPNGGFDVYFYHKHGNDLYNQEDGVGCCKYTNETTGESYQSGYNCVLKLVPVDETGKPILKSGSDGATIILSLTGHPRGPQQIFRLDLTRYRTYDAISHKLLLDIKEDSSNHSLNSVTRNSSQGHNVLGKDGDKEFGDNMYRRAARMSNCPLKPFVRDDEY